MLGKENGVTICDKHSFHDFGLIMTNKVISGPVPKTKKVEVPARNGSIDMTEVVTDDVKYEDRTINISFFAGNDLDALPAITSKIQTAWSGMKAKITVAAPTDIRALLSTGGTSQPTVPLTSRTKE